MQRLVGRQPDQKPFTSILAAPGKRLRREFHTRLRHECLNQEVLWTLTEARVVIEDFRRHYNERRPHGKLGYQSPARFAALQCPLTTASLTEAGQNHSTQLQTNQSQD